MGISDFRRAKLMYVFETFFDTDKSGTIEKPDFILAARQVCKVRNWPESDPRFAQVEKSFMTMWEVLRKRCYKEDNENITPEEFCQLWHNPDQFEDWEKTYMELTFELQDTSGDGVVDDEEFATVCDSYGVNPAESRQAFATFSSRGHIKVDKKYFQKLWTEYFNSDNPGDLGNFLFGKTSFE